MNIGLLIPKRVVAFAFYVSSFLVATPQDQIVFEELMGLFFHFTKELLAKVIKRTTPLNDHNSFNNLGRLESRSTRPTQCEIFNGTDQVITNLLRDHTVRFICFMSLNEMPHPLRCRP